MPKRTHRNPDHVKQYNAPAPNNQAIANQLEALLAHRFIKLQLNPGLRFKSFHTSLANIKRLRDDEQEEQKTLFKELKETFKGKSNSLPKSLELLHKQIPLKRILCPQRIFATQPIF